MRKLIFGKVYNFTNQTSNEWNLEKFLDGYTDVVQNTHTDVNVVFVDQIRKNSNCIVSPKSHRTFSGGFISDYGGTEIKYELMNSSVSVEICMSRGSLIGKLISPDYCDNFDILGTLLHELVFVPMNFFDQSKLILHASGFVKDNRVTLIGGTGGVGKSSLQLIACRENLREFVCDDIAILDDNQNVYPNYAFPKVYGYNTVGDIQLMKKLHENMSLPQRLHWHLKSKIFGLSKVRNAVSTKKLYQNVAHRPNKFGKYFVLQRSETDNEIRIEALTSKQAASSALSIIETEYFTFFQHVMWHENLCSTNGVKPIITMSDVRKTLYKNYVQAFETVNCFLVSIPTELTHADFMTQMIKWT